MIIDELIDELREFAYRWFNMGYKTGVSTVIQGEPEDAGMAFAMYWDDEKAQEMLK